MTVYNVGDIYLEDLSGGTSDQLHIYAQAGNIADGAVTDAKLAPRGVKYMLDVIISNDNLYDVQTSGILECSMTPETGNLFANSNCRTVYVPCKPDTTYVITKTPGGRFCVGTLATTPAAGRLCADPFSDATASEIVYTTNDTASYLCAFVWFANTDGDDYGAMLDSVVIREVVAVDPQARADSTEALQKVDTVYHDLFTTIIDLPMSRSFYNDLFMYISLPFTMLAGVEYELAFKYTCSFDPDRGQNNNFIVFKPATADGVNTQTSAFRLTKANLGSYSERDHWYYFTLTPNDDCPYLLVARYGYLSEFGELHVSTYTGISGITDQVDQNSADIGYSRTYPYDGDKISIKRYTLDCEQFGTRDKPSGITGSYQGAAVYGDTFVQLFDQGYFGLYSLPSLGTAFASGALGSTGTSQHANNAMFGGFYAEGDALPLLYVTGGNASSTGRGYCSVERITQTDGVYSSELVQTITVDQSNFVGSGYQTVFPYQNYFVWDDKLVTFGAIYRTNGSMSQYDNVNRYVVHMFELPDITQQAVELTASDIVREIVFPYDVEYMQGGTIASGILFHAFGSGGNGGSHIRAYDLVGGREIARIDTDGMPHHSYEPESFAEYNDSLIAIVQGSNVYKITF